ncbi:MAG: hypothetical protein JOS17DRAFT_726666 [Linnemannia elongata]|nr:MAG: hypothetical protein JOS17DRAFT_726666 [Linnemannia elongata]
MLFIKTVVLLCSATAAMAASAVVSGALFVGEDTTNYDATPVEIYRNVENHAAAAASILIYSANSTDFHPASQEPKALGQILDHFVKKASTFPGFLTQSISDQNVALNGSLTQFEKVIRESLEDPLTARAFRDLVPGYIQDKSLTDWIISLIVLSQPKGSNIVSLRQARVTLTLSTDNTQTVIIPKQSARLIVSDYKIFDQFFIKNADKFASSYPVYRVRDFIDFFASPKVLFEEEQIQRDSTSCPQNYQTVMSWFL